MQLFNFSLNLILQVVGAKSLEDFVAQLKRPRRIMLMVKAGQVRQISLISRCIKFNKDNIYVCI